MMKEKFTQDKIKSNRECLEELNSGMNNLAKETNTNYGLELLKKDGTANPEAFGPMDQKEAEFINNRINSWSGVDSPDARKTFAKFHNLESLNEEELTQQMLNYWKNKKENSNSTMFEMMTTIIFRKALGKDYIVMRSSEFDDYKNGVDNIIINTKTNEVVCAFDEVQEPKVGNRLNEKNKKIIKKAQDGGTQIKHALKFNNGKAEKTSLSNIPIFYITSETDELRENLQKINCHDLNTASDFEWSLYIKFASGIIQQAEMLLQQENIPELIKKRLEKVSDFFVTINTSKK